MALPSRAMSAASQRAPMPHVSTLYQSVDVPPRQSLDARKLLSSQRQRPIQVSRSMPSSPQKKINDEARFHYTQQLMTTPEFAVGDFSSLDLPQQHFAEFYSPSLGSESMFELPTVTFESPRSSTNTSFVAELEDTSVFGDTPSPSVKLIRVPSTTDTVMLFKSNKLTSRAIIKVVDETIAAIEASNRELLARAEAAEATSYRLLDQNTKLQIELDECRHSYRSPLSAHPHPPQKCFGTQTSPRHTPHTSVDRNGSPQPKSPVPSTMLLSYNASLDVPQEPSRKPSLNSLRSTTRHHEEAFSVPLPSPTLPIRPRNLSVDRPQTADATTTTTSATSRSLPPIPTTSRLSIPTVSSPLLPHSRRHTRVLSVEEAKKIAATKPLPPLGPMSPSVVQGVVELGLGVKEEANLLGSSGSEANTDGSASRYRHLRSKKSWIRFRSKEDGFRSGDGRDERRKQRERDGEREKEREWRKLTMLKAEAMLLKWAKKGDERERERGTTVY